MSLRSSRLGFKSRPGRSLYSLRSRIGLLYGACCATGLYDCQTMLLGNGLRVEPGVAQRRSKISLKTVAERLKAEVLVELVAIFSMYTA